MSQSTLVKQEESEGLPERESSGEGRRSYLCLRVPAALRGRRGRVGLAVVAVAFALAMPALASPFYVSLLALGIAYGLFAFGLDLAWGRAGIVSIGHAVFFGLGAYGLVIGTEHGLPAVAGGAIGVALALLLALLMGVGGLRAGSNPSTMAVLTLAVTLLAAKIATAWVGFTGGTNGLFYPSPESLSNYYYLTLLVTVVVVVTTWALVLRRSLGNRLAAVRINEQRAAHLGIPVQRCKMIALGLSAVVSAIAGALAAPLIGLVSPELVGIVLSTQVLIWVAIGGRNSMLGPFVGAVTLTLGANLLSDVTLNYYVLALGVVFVLVVIVAPEGLLGWIKRRQVTPFSSAEQAPVDAHGHSDGDGPVLRARGVVKRFGNSVVVDGVDLDVARGEIVCLIGPNGAGKSTFLNVVSGALPLNAGSVQLMGVDCTDRPPHDRCSKGLGRTFQVPELFSELSVGEHFDLAHQESATNAHALPDRYRRVEQELGTSLTTELSLGDRRNLEIAMTLARGPRLLLLDEPAAGLSHDQSLELATTLRSARDATGCAMIVVEHDLDIVRALADRVAVLHQGRILCEGTMDEIEQHAIVRSAYLGAV